MDVISVDMRVTTMAEKNQGCIQPAAGPLVPAPVSEAPITPPEKEVHMLARVGKEAPDFEASAYVKGEGFKNVKLSDYKGQWIVLCFYPGDFTFV